jgi:acyl CoA:acetate/3-ketoacid CoA transferase beta subunit
MKRHSPQKKGGTDMTAFKLTELMSIRCAKEIMDGEVVFVGVGLPLVVAGYAMKTHAKNMIMCTEGGAIRATSPPGLAITVDDPCLFTGADATYGMLATMAALQRGEIDVAFIGGAQIDKFGNINSTGVGDWAKKESFTYFAGSGGANDMATSGKRVLGILPQDKKKFVEKVDYITTPGFLGGPGQRFPRPLPDSSFFLRLVHFAGAHRLVQRVGFQTQFISDFRDGSFGIEQFLNLGQDRRGQHRRATANARGEKTSHPLASIQLDAPQHTDLAHPESPTDLSLGENHSLPKVL